MREKLIELLGNTGSCINWEVNSCAECQYGNVEDCYSHALADHLIANGVTIQKWIPVTDRLPEYGQQVIVYFGNILSKQVMSYHFWSKDFDGWVNVTHWMPLPEPPKEGDPRE